MRVLPIAVLCLCSAAYGVDPGLSSDFEMEKTIPLVTPPLSSSAKPFEAIVDSRHETRSDDRGDTEQLGEDFRLLWHGAITEDLTLSEELKLGIDRNTLSTNGWTLEDQDSAVAIEVTKLQWKLMEKLHLEMLAQQQLLKSQATPFAEIVTYGTGVSVQPRNSTTFKVQFDHLERSELDTVVRDENQVRASLEQSLIPKILTLQTGVVAGIQDDLRLGQSTQAEGWDGKVSWTVQPQTLLTVSSDLTEKTNLDTDTQEIISHWGFAWDQKLSSVWHTKLDFQRENRATESEAATTANGAWNFGAATDFSLIEDWKAAIGIHYRRPDTLPLAGEGEVGLSLSFQGRF